MSPNSRLFLACQNAILVDVSIYTEKNGTFLLQLCSLSLSSFEKTK
ncbi:hypothetical protein LEP1GSC083_3294 [Leptospira interrogans serovar Pyrogenes str. L0374]|uniref:Uncharacterized protein n=1 Tax=Leptospira interrogans serovar Pyrogenes str. L0374 TaxID=1049928 RepID=M6K353_LEPIR|nr:hypothetical protein LEP1GSC083_3294 [Leptospira interrogans serovar Pyrogenes str. L0374]